MSSVSLIFSQSLSFLKSLHEEETPKVILWKGTSIPCVLNTEQDAAVLEIGGLDASRSIRVYIEASAVYPALKDTVTYDGRKWTVDGVAKIGAGSVIRLDLTKFGKGV